MGDLLRLGLCRESVLLGMCARPVDVAEADCYAACAVLTSNPAAEWTPPPRSGLEVFGLVCELEIFVFVLILIVVEVAEASGEGGCGQNGGGSGLRVAVLVDLHAEREPHLREDLFDLIQR